VQAAAPIVYPTCSCPRAPRAQRQFEVVLQHDEEGESGTLLGRIGLLHHEDWPEDPENVEVGWLLDRAVWGRGLATEGALASLRYGFQDLRLERIISIAHPDNRASRRVMEKVGLVFSGEREWRGGSVVWYSIERPAWETRAAMEASASAADDMRSRAASDAGGEIVDVHEFDLVYAHLHVPEMA